LDDLQLCCHVSLPRSRSRAIVNALIGLVSGLFWWNKGGTRNFFFAAFFLLSGFARTFVFLPSHCARGWIAKGVHAKAQRRRKARRESIERGF
jgi:hypothetical protein